MEKINNWKKKHQCKLAKKRFFFFYFDFNKKENKEINNKNLDILFTTHKYTQKILEDSTIFSSSLLVCFFYFFWIE